MYEHKRHTRSTRHRYSDHIGHLEWSDYLSDHVNRIMWLYNQITAVIWLWEIISPIDPCLRAWIPLIWFISLVYNCSCAKRIKWGEQEGLHHNVSRQKTTKWNKTCSHLFLLLVILFLKTCKKTSLHPIIWFLRVFVLFMSRKWAQWRRQTWKQYKSTIMSTWNRACEHLSKGEHHLYCTATPTLAHWACSVRREESGSFLHH